MCQPQPIPDPAPVIEPEDKPFPGLIRLAVDATDIQRRIFRVRETVPVGGAGPMTLLFPEWLPGYHSPQAPIELFAGLMIRAGGEMLDWKRHPTRVHAFHFDVPEGVDRIECEFQFLSPTAPAQGREVVGSELLSLQWNAMLLYPAGHYARQIMFEPTLTLPDGWAFATALETASADGPVARFAPVPLDVLVDSPLFAGRHFRRVPLDQSGSVRLNMFADAPEMLDASDNQIAPHRALVEQADRLFGARHFDHFEILLALTEEVGAIGVEHHRSCEAVSITGYFTDWDTTFARRDTIPHEYVHSWNGKYRRGADSWTPSFDKPIRNSLMWVYEGLTQYLGRVLCTRSGLWSREQALGALAQTAATHQARAGSRWRPMSDTTRDPIIASRSPLPWTSWQRSADYYSEGALVWLDADTRVREMTGEARSLDDFAAAFFGRDDGRWTTSTYTFDDVVETLHGIAPYDWAGFFTERLEGRHEGAPLAGLERGGYRLVFGDTPTSFWESSEKVFGTLNLMFSLGLTLSPAGEVQEVLWEGPAFDAAITAGSEIEAVNGRAFTPDEIRRAIGHSGEGEAVELLVRSGKRHRSVTLDYRGGHRYPRLEPLPGAAMRLHDILRPRDR